MSVVDELLREAAEVAKPSKGEVSVCLELPDEWRAAIVTEIDGVEFVFEGRGESKQDALRAVLVAAEGLGDAG